MSMTLMILNFTCCMCTNPWNISWLSPLKNWKQILEDSIVFLEISYTWLATFCDIMKTVMERVLFELSWILAEGFLPGWLFAADSNLLNMYLHLWEWKIALVTYCALQLLHTDSCKDRIFMCFKHTANLATIANTAEFACTNQYLER